MHMFFDKMPPSQAQPPAGPPSHTIAGAVALIQRWGVLVAAAVFAIVAMSSAGPADAQTVAGYTDARTGAVLNVAVNKSTTLRVDRALGKAAVANPDIADVLPVSMSSVYVMGRAIGSTNVSLFDKKGGLIAVVDVVVTPDSQGLKRKLAELMPTEPVGVSVSNDSLVLGGTVSSAGAADRVATIAETYAPKKVINMMSVGSAQQVLLEVRFSEMQRGTVKQLGINNISYSGIGSSGFAAVTSPDRENNPFQFGINIPGAGNLTIQLDALERQGIIRTLAQPNLVALSGETASFLAGGEFPVPTGVTQNGQVSIEFKQFGVSLAFTPTVLEDGLINLLVAPEVSALDPDAGISLNGIVVPGLKTRRARTMVELRDGQSFALAGLIQSDFANTVRAIPLLGRIPIIGALFRSTSYNRNETELVIVVTPRIVRPAGVGVKLALPTDRINEPSDVEMFLLGRTERRTPMTPASTPPAAIRPGGVDGELGHIVR
ncbi:general secretion pathway protein [Polymorphobacter glacialis]|uniref:General secretion pathway protein n=2 Tax=Sandarakinorhabdus glacialis TaxID=1614636 RepID=A0A916ZSX2_9SPHN|nr:general secretion pathway protein [Polymorphobacter glacialis]